jgi:hypothetical protein
MNAINIGNCVDGTTRIIGNYIGRRQKIKISYIPAIQ